MKNLLLTFSILLLPISVVHSQDKELEESMKRGSEIYMDFCVTCHLENGEGILGTFPPLAESDYLMKNREASIRGVQYGQQGEIVVNGTTYNNAEMGEV